MRIQNLKVKKQNYNLKFKTFGSLFAAFTFYFLLLTFLTGCEGFKRKFVRKQKNKTPEEAFYAPREYKRTVSLENEYNEYFFFWKRSQEELMSDIGGYYKKQIALSRRTIDNLAYMRNMLEEEKAKPLTEYIQQLSLIHEEIKDSHGFFTSGKASKLARELNSIYNDIRKNYSYKKIKDFIKQDNG